MLDAAGTAAAVAVLDAEAVGSVIGALASWGPRARARPVYCLLLAACGDNVITDGDVPAGETRLIFPWLIPIPLSFGLQVTPFAVWARQRRSGPDVDMLDGAATATSPSVVPAPPCDGHAPIKRRRYSTACFIDYLFECCQSGSFRWETRWPSTLTLHMHPCRLVAPGAMAQPATSDSASEQRTSCAIQ